MTKSNLPIDYTVMWMKKHNVPLTAENYLHIQFLGQNVPEPPYDGELEAELPREIQAAELRAKRKIEAADRKFLRDAGVAR